MINPTRSECSKLVQKEYMTKHDWAGIVIHWELRKKSQFTHTNKCNIHKPESVVKNERYEIF